MARSTARPWRRGSLPVGITGIVIVIVLIGVTGAARPTMLANPIISAVAAAIAGAAAGYVTKRALGSTIRLRWRLSR